MIKVVLGLVIVAVLAVGLVALAMYWVVKSRYRGRKAPELPALDLIKTPTSELGACARCGEQRIIVSRHEGMCASCYSALRTKAVS